MTVQTQLIVQALLKDPARELYGLELSEETGLLPGTAYPILLRLENEGWVRFRADGRNRTAGMIISGAGGAVVPTSAAVSSLVISNVSSR